MCGDVDEDGHHVEHAVGRAEREEDHLHHRHTRPADGMTVGGRGWTIDWLMD